MRGRLWILPPDAPAIQPGGPLEASAGHGPERRQGPRMRTARAARWGPRLGADW